MADLRTLYRTLPRAFSSIPRHATAFTVLVHRTFATTVQDVPVPSRISSASSPSQSGPAGYTRRSPTNFGDKLNAGPSFNDFVGGNAAEAELSLEDALELQDEESPRIGDAKTGRELRKVMVGPEGKKREVTRLPEWLKTPIPSSDNFKAIKNDLRGLNLHTGMSRASHPLTSNPSFSHNPSSLRRSPLSQHLLLLGRFRQIRRHRHNNAHGRHLHPRLPLLLR